MAGELMTRGKGCWRSLGGVLLVALGGCATRETESGPSAFNPAAPSDEMQQVVQRVLPAQGSAAPGAAPPRAATAPAGAAERFAPSAALRGSRSTRRAQAISSKHLEAELNRLEAELGR